MAIEQAVLVAVGTSDDDDRLRLTNIDAKYQDYEHEELRRIRCVFNYANHNIVD